MGLIFLGDDPGDCIVCGAKHCACGPASMSLVQLPNRDAAAAAAVPVVAVSSTPVNDAIQATLPPTQFTTGTYRRRTRTKT